MPWNWTPTGMGASTVLGAPSGRARRIGWPAEADAGAQAAVERRQTAAAPTTAPRAVRVTRVARVPRAARRAAVIRHANGDMVGGPSLAMAPVTYRGPSVTL